MSPVGFTPASDLAFGVVFGVFVLALAVLGFISVRWGIRRDRPGRQAWRDRQLRTREANSQNGHLESRARPGSPLDER